MTCMGIVLGVLLVTVTASSLGAGMVASGWTWFHKRDLTPPLLLNRFGILLIIVGKGLIRMIRMLAFIAFLTGMFLGSVFTIVAACIHINHPKKLMTDMGEWFK